MSEWPPPITKLSDAVAALAECFRLSGADPDGNADWRLAPRAVREVRRLREEHDELVDDAVYMRAALKRANNYLIDEQPELAHLAITDALVTLGPNRGDVYE